MALTSSQYQSRGRSSHHHLARLAEALRPTKPPWYVRHPLAASLEASFPHDGWYWIPDGQHTAQFLGRTTGIAEHNLRTRLDRLDA
ncbi:MAG: hypothetical protein M3Y09_14030 [Actinomycetota bacterium]|nr:hypothetical protein [Actinomycetota bacterium]